MAVSNQTRRTGMRSARIPLGWADDDPNFEKVIFDLSPAALAPAFGGRAPKALTERQRGRLDSVLRATLRLADEGGYEAVRMRDLGDTGVALGTIYRFFGSRDFLVFYATNAWTERAAVRSLPRRSGRSFRDDCRYQFDRLMAQYEKHPRIIEAWARALTSDDPSVGDFVRIYKPEAILHGWPPMDQFDPSYALNVRAAIEQHTFGQFVRLVHGHKTLVQIREDHEHLLALIFDPPLRATAAKDGR